MPGGRLTYDDRQRIAARLADGHSYAEIARALERPTSTVSREVTRNGGYDGYRADHAHRAAGRRARRSRVGLSSAPEATDPYERDRAAMRGFTERFVAMMVETGLPRMVARTLACFLTSDSTSVTAAELVERLQVSPASISKAVGYLENLQLVRRERDPRGRRERYVIDDDVWYRAWSASVRSIAMWADTARQGAGVLGAGTPAGDRLDEMATFFGLLGRDMAEAGERRRQGFVKERQRR
ncbi:GbsR/MarR family transcriptional regulator [Actinopolymorpha alba]|uniref:GbsR/MarR family transcriptional regulator n=1 Tax=Actinopolymorpha alba TaxID=533267 RepID=UPI000361F92D|nr:helix-turn-helix domain-containing protein [Actinopolymorpha alba]